MLSYRLRHHIPTAIPVTKPVLISHHGSCHNLATAAMFSSSPTYGVERVRRVSEQLWMLLNR